jgi:hypothetical protein
MRKKVAVFIDIFLIKISLAYDGPSFIARQPGFAGLPTGRTLRCPMFFPPKFLDFY